MLLGGAAGVLGWWLVLLDWLVPETVWDHIHALVILDRYWWLELRFKVVDVL